MHRNGLVAFKNKVFFSLVLVSLHVFSLPAYAQLRQIYEDAANPNNAIQKLSFYSPSQGFVAFSNWIGFTTDSGRTFTQKPVTTSNVNYNGNPVNLTFGFDILGVKAFDQNTLIAYGDYGFVPTILYSTDGGNTFTVIFWSQYDPLTLRTGITDMAFPQNDNTGFAVDADRILKTVDKGLTWSVVSNNPASYFNYLEAVDDNHIYAFSTGTNTNKLFATSNSGARWQQMTLPAGLLNYATFLTANNGWVNISDNAGGGAVYYTTNGGGTWTQKNNSQASPFGCVKMKFVNDSTGFAIQGLFQMSRTTDSGKVWEPLPRDNTFTYLGFSFNDLQCITNTQCWTGGGHGFLELSTNSGGTPYPKAFFLIDTSGLSATASVKLVNYSRPGYTYNWLRNNNPIGSTYNNSYTHNAYPLKDTITLIVSNGSASDTNIQYVSFYPPVTLSSFSPTAAAAGTLITIKGANLTGATSVTFGGSPAVSFNVVSDSVITATVGTGATGSVFVGTPTGTAQLLGFIFLPAPVISSFDPPSAIAGTTITIQGLHFTGATAVTFGNTPATIFTIVSDDEITALPASGSTGAITIVSPGGTATLAGFAELPNMTGFTPTTGSNGVLVLISGTGFENTTAVTVGGIPVRSFTINSSTSVNAIVSSGASGSVAVTTTAGTTTLPGFTFVQAPRITAFTPLSGAVGTQVQISGANFGTTPAANTVYFGVVKATITAASSNALTVIVPPGASYSPISVTTAGLTANTDQPFTLTFPNGGSITPHSFAPALDFNYATSPSSYLTGLAIGDIDGDGKPDIAESEGILTGISIARNTGTPGTISFTLATGFAPGYQANGFGLCDMDGDGALDMLLLVSDTIFVFGNTSTPGNISFSPVTKINASTGTTAFSILDVDGDGRPDLLLTNANGDSLFVMLNSSSKGSFSFGSPINIGIVGGGPIGISDLDGDGKLDLIVMHNTSNTVSVIKNNSTIGNPSFIAVTDISMGFPSGLFIGDMDGDGKPDIGTTDGQRNTVSVCLNTSTGATISFAPKQDFSAGNTPTGISISDMDGDGLPDMVVANTSDTTVSVFKNISTPGHLNFSARTDFTAQPTPSTIILCDMDGDGKNDLIAMSESKFDIHTLRNTVLPEPFIQSFTPTSGVSGTAVTIIGDNFTDATAVSFGGTPAASFTIDSSKGITAILATGASGSVSVTNAYGTAATPGFTYGNIPSILSVSPITGPIGSSVTISGTNFDPNPTANIVYFGQVQATVLSATANTLVATAPVATTYDAITVTTNQRTAYAATPFTPTFPDTITAFTQNSFAGQQFVGGLQGSTADLDGDGKLDIIFKSTANSLSVLRNTSTPKNISFASLQNFPSEINYRLAVGDIDGDGKPDIVTANSNNSFSFLHNTSTPGNISFAPNIDFSTGDPNSEPNEIKIVDIDKDGRPDVITVSYQQQTMSVFRNLSANGQIAFDTRVVYALNGYPTGIAFADIDGDGLTDIALSTTGPASVFRNTSITGFISFAPRQDFPTGGNWPEYIQTGDIDGDGKPDLAIANINSNQLSLFLNTSSTGNISFAPVANFTTGDGPFYLSMGDLDGDGKPDFVMPNVYTAIGNPVTMSILKNQSTTGHLNLLPELEYPVVPYEGNSSPVNGAIADIDGDGKSDIVMFGGNAGLNIFRNQIGEDLTPQLSTPTITSLNDSVFCSGNIDTLSSSERYNNQWYRNGMILANDTSNILIVNQSGIYTAASSLGATTTPQSSGISITALPIPATPTITADTLGLLSSADAGNQWYTDTTAIVAGAIGQRYKPLTQGFYSVKVTLQGCSSPFSALYDYTLSSPATPTAPPPNDTIYYSPNPVGNFITVTFDPTAITQLTVQLTSLSGTAVLLKTNVLTGDKIDISNLMPGVYVIRFIANNGQIRITNKLLKL
jgi:photosystem II stability/assembly factor-like uncharacterized protein